MNEADGSHPKCNCLEFMSDGKSIITGWTDGRIRAYLPQSGQLFYLIKDGHRGNNPTALSPGGTTCLSTSLNCQNCLTGGTDGEIRLWQIGKQTQKLIISQRMHKGPITAIMYIQNDYMAASASIDGQIMLWDLT